MRAADRVARILTPAPRWSTVSNVVARQQKAGVGRPRKDLDAWCGGISPAQAFCLSGTQEGDEMPDSVRVSDTSVAAFLLARGFRIVKVEGSPGRREFIFADVPDEAILNFFGGDDQVSARRLLDCLKNLKGLLVGVST